MQKKLDGWKMAGEGTYWKPKEKGEILTGEYLESFESKYGTCFKIKQEDGSVMITPSWRALMSKMSEVETGMLVRIEYLGESEAKTGLNPTKLFNVQYKPAN